MKKLFPLLLFIVLLSACSAAPTQQTLSTFTEDIDDFVFTRYRTDLKSSKEVPSYELITITTYQELLDYYEAEKDVYNLEESYFSNTDPFKTLADSLSSAYFESNHLVIFVMEEPSGSHRHELEDVFVEDGILTIHLERLRASIGTADMANWHLVLQVPHASSDIDDIEYTITTVTKN